MTKAIAIFLIAVHLTNIVGSCGMIVHAETAHQKQISERLDEDEFAGSNTIMLRVPLSLPYSTYTENYERVSGRIEYDGQIYQLVKQKFYNDTLFIVCVQDSKLSEIKNVVRNIAASMSDIPDEKPIGKIRHLLIKDYESCPVVQVRASLFQMGNIQLPVYTFSAGIISVVQIDQPPRA